MHNRHIHLVVTPSFFERLKLAIGYDYGSVTQFCRNAVVDALVKREIENEQRAAEKQRETDQLIADLGDAETDDAETS